MKRLIVILMSILFLAGHSFAMETWQTLSGLGVICAGTAFGVGMAGNDHHSKTNNSIAVGLAGLGIASLTAANISYNASQKHASFSIVKRF